MKKFISILLVLAMVLMLGACGGPSEKDALLGSWKTVLDMTDIFNDSMAAGAGEEMGPYLEVQSFDLVMTLTLNQDDTYSMILDETALESTVQAIRADLQAGIEQYLVDSVAAMGVEMSIEDILAASGISMEDMMAEIISDEMIDSLVSDITAEGKFKAKDGKLFLSAGLEYEVDERVYETYTLDGTTLTLVEYISPEGVDELTASLYPMVFEKIG